MRSDKLNYYLQLQLIVFIWGFTSVLGALISLDALSLVWFRMVFASLFIGIYAYFFKLDLTLTVKQLVFFLLAGSIIALHWFTFFKAIKVSNISITLACLSSGAFFVSVLKPLLTAQKVVYYEVVLGILVIVGLCILVHVENMNIQGVILALISAFLSALFSIINEIAVKQHDSTVIAFYELLGGVLFFTIILSLTNSYSLVFFTLNWVDLVYLLILSSVCTAYALITSVKIMKHLSAFTVMLSINLEPVYGIILAVLIFDEKEKMSTGFYVGAVIILVIILLNAFIKNKDVQE
ncbi:MAG: DMT family transporter [Flavobacterium psychrophilum]